MRSTDVHRRLKKLADPKRALGVARFFKTGPGEYGEGDRFLGIALPDLRTVAREFSDLPLTETARLLKSSWHEERLIALLILVRQYTKGTPAERDAIYRLYLKHTDRINNWDLVDVSAAQIVGAHLYEGKRVPLRQLAHSSSVWERRIAIIATFHHIRRGQFAETLQVTRWLLHDRHDLIHKAAGWMLREVGKRNRRVEEQFLNRYAHMMPRTMLRYAIERFPSSRRRWYLGRRERRARAAGSSGHRGDDRRG